MTRSRNRCNSSSSSSRPNRPGTWSHSRRWGHSRRRHHCSRRKRSSHGNQRSAQATANNRRPSLWSPMSRDCPSHCPWGSLCRPAVWLSPSRGSWRRCRGLIRWWQPCNCSSSGPLPWLVPHPRQVGLLPRRARPS
jgi:hypothetical protein